MKEEKEFTEARELRIKFPFSIPADIYDWIEKLTPGVSYESAGSTLAVRPKEGARLFVIIDNNSIGTCPIGRCDVLWTTRVGASLSDSNEEDIFYLPGFHPSHGLITAGDVVVR